MATHRPIDLLPDREADTLAAWLADHPGVEVICRDRGGAYAAGARTGAPAAIQVADRWHLWKNLADHVEKTAYQHRGCLLDQPEPARAETDPAVDPNTADRDERIASVHAELFEQRLFVQHARERYTAVQALKAEGLGIKAIKRRLGLAKETVRKYYRATSIEDILANARDGRDRLLADYKPYLHERFNDGATNGSQLFREIRDQGYRGSLGTVLAYLKPFRTTGAAPSPASAPPKARDVTRWIVLSTTQRRLTTWNPRFSASRETTSASIPRVAACSTNFFLKPVSTHTLVRVGWWLSPR